MTSDLPSQHGINWLGLPVVATVARLLCRELTLRNEYLRVENRVLRSKLPGRIGFTDADPVVPGPGPPRTHGGSRHRSDDHGGVDAPRRSRLGYRSVRREAQGAGPEAPRAAPDASVVNASRRPSNREALRRTRRSPDTPSEYRSDNRLRNGGHRCRFQRKRCHVSFRRVRTSESAREPGLG